MVIKYKEEALNAVDFAELTKYLETNKRVLPIYNFLPAKEKETNYLEFLIRNLTGDDTKNIEYWVRDREQSTWHVDGDEVTQRLPGKHVDEIANTTHLLYITSNGYTGGDLQICVDEPYTGGKLLNTGSWKPRNGAHIIRIKPKPNLAISFPSNLYHRVMPIVPTLSGLTPQRLVLVWSYWETTPVGYRENHHWGFTNAVFGPVKWKENI